jgi:hypothetical protein
MADTRSPGKPGPAAQAAGCAQNIEENEKSARLARYLSVNACIFMLVFFLFL